LKHNEREYDARFHNRHDNGWYASITLHRASTRFERAEDDSGRDHRGGVEPREQCDGDRSENVSRRDVLLEREGHTAHFDRASEAGECTAREKCTHRDTFDVDLSGRTRGVRIRTNNAKSESGGRVSNHPPAGGTRENRNRESKMKARRRP
jgi:hypothetical protein